MPRQPHGRGDVPVRFQARHGRQFLSAAAQVVHCAPSTKRGVQERPHLEGDFTQLGRGQSAQRRVPREQGGGGGTFDFRFQQNLVRTVGPRWAAWPAEFEDGTHMALTPATELRGDTLDVVCLLRRGGEAA